MYKSLTKIAITGGPCGGKTTALARISKELPEKGYEVLIVPEAATAIKNIGIKIGESKGYLSIEEFQRIIINFQIFQENLSQNYAKNLNDKDVIILYDRGLADSNAYVDSKVYKKVLDEFDLTQIEARDRYNAVIHLKTVADGKEEYYTLANNIARTETAEEARLVDKKTINAWIGHPHFRIIDNSTDFDGKMDKLMSEIYTVLGLPIPIELENKYLIKMPDLDEIVSKYNAVKSEIMQIYLSSQNPNEELRIRQRGIDGSYSYYFTKKIKRNDNSRYEIEEKISSDRYLELLTNADPAYSVIKKARYCFVYMNQYFELDIYSINPEYAILEIELTKENTIVNIPPEIKVLKDVTADDRFKNSNIAKNINIFDQI